MRPESKAFACDLFISDVLREAYTKSLAMPQVLVGAAYGKVSHSRLSIFLK